MHSLQDRALALWQVPPVHEFCHVGIVGIAACGARAGSKPMTRRPFGLMRAGPVAQAGDGRRQPAVPMGFQIGERRETREKCLNHLVADVLGRQPGA